MKNNSIKILISVVVVLIALAAIYSNYNSIDRTIPRDVVKEIRTSCMEEVNEIHGKNYHSWNRAVYECSKLKYKNI